MTAPKTRRVLPPVYFALALAAIVLLHLFAPVARLIPRPISWAGAALVLLGGFVVVSSARRFGRMRTTIKPFQRSSVLVTDGFYRYTRNPMYLSMVLTLLGVAVLLGTLAPLLVVPVFAALIERRFIRAEEAMLEEAFGEEYEAYRKRVRRWL